VSSLLESEVLPASATIPSGQSSYGPGRPPEGCPRAGRRGWAIGHRRERVRDGPGRGGSGPTVAPGRPLVGAGRARGSPGTRARTSGPGCGRAGEKAGLGLHGAENGTFRDIALGARVERPGVAVKRVAKLVQQPDISRSRSLGRGPVVSQPRAFSKSSSASPWQAPVHLAPVRTMTVSL
jgi:hypothetical protein